MINIENTENLSVNEQYALITDIQNVPTTVETRYDEDGNAYKYVTYGVTPASEAAGEKLMAAFWPAIISAARSTHLEGPDAREEAEAVALEAFVRAVREFDLTADTPFHHVARRLMKFAVLRNDREESSNHVHVPAVQVARYHRMMHRFGDDVTAAYEAASAARDDEDASLMSRESFLAVHHALTGTSEDMDAPAFLPPSEDGPEAAFVEREYARWLLSELHDEAHRAAKAADAAAQYTADSVKHAEKERDEWAEWAEVLQQDETATPTEIQKATRELTKRERALRAAQKEADRASALVREVADAQRIAAVREAACRLKYGFSDLDTESLSVMLERGYRPGDVLLDRQVADVLDMSRPAVQREITKALAVMRAAAEAAIAGE